MNADPKWDTGLHETNVRLQMLLPKRHRLCRRHTLRIATECFESRESEFPPTTQKCRVINCKIRHNCYQ